LSLIERQNVVVPFIFQAGLIFAVKDSFTRANTQAYFALLRMTNKSFITLTTGRLHDGQTKIQVCLKHIKLAVAACLIISLSLAAALGSQVKSWGELGHALR
jgi:hypothetical protein